jgi:hypothetical protein
LRMSCPYSSHQNGRAKRLIRTTNNVMCSLLFQASLPACYRAEGLVTVTYLLIHLPTKVVSHPTPFSALFGTSPSYNHLQVFGCACYPNFSATIAQKLAPISLGVCFLGTPRIIRGIGASISPPIGSSSLVTLSLTRLTSHSPPPLLMPLLWISTPSCTTTLWSLHHSSLPCFLHKYTSHATMRSPDAYRAATHGLGVFRAATRGPNVSGAASRGTGVSRAATRGTDATHTATRGPVVYVLAMLR